MTRPKKNAAAPPPSEDDPGTPDQQQEHRRLAGQMYVRSVQQLFEQGPPPLGSLDDPRIAQRSTSFRNQPEQAATPNGSYRDQRRQGFSPPDGFGRDQNRKRDHEPNQRLLLGYPGKKSGGARQPEVCRSFGSSGPPQTGVL